MRSLSMTLCTILAISSIITTNAGRIGMNLEGKNYNFDDSVTWKNRFLGAAPFTSSNKNLSLDLDVNGYVKSLKPNQVANTYLFKIFSFDGQWHVPNQGIHIFTYTGNCSDCLFLDCAKIVDKSMDGKWTVNITYGGHCDTDYPHVGFSIRNISDPANYQRNFTLTSEIYYPISPDDISEPESVIMIQRTVN